MKRVKSGSIMPVTSRVDRQRCDCRNGTLDGIICENCDKVLWILATDHIDSITPILCVTTIKYSMLIGSVLYAMFDK